MQQAEQRTSFLFCEHMHTWNSFSGEDSVTYLVKTAATNQAIRQMNDALVFVQIYPALRGLQMA